VTVPPPRRRTPSKGTNPGIRSRPVTLADVRVPVMPAEALEPVKSAVVWEPDRSVEA
jgi:hypothetical protein